MAFLQTDVVVTKIGELFNQGTYTTHYDHTQADGTFRIQVSRFNDQTQLTETFDWFTVNPTTGDFVSDFNGFAGSLITPEDITIVASFVSDGTKNNLQTTVTFPQAFDEAPTVVAGNIVQTVSYCDTMQFPFITNVSKTGFTVIVRTVNSVNNFGSGTLKMNFRVSDKK